MARAATGAVARLAWLAVLVTACGGSPGHGGGTTPAPDGDAAGDAVAAGPAGPAGPADGEVAAADASDRVCAAYGLDEADPLRRWVNAFPVQGGGVVLAFVGAEAAPMDVEASLEMAGIMGYEVEVCGTAVVVWVPGVECGGDDSSLARRVENGTTMALGDSQCFRIDETRLRLAEECGRGTITGDACP